MVWIPVAAAQRWLSGLLFKQVTTEDRLLARFTLKGNFIWSAEDPTMYLDGEGFGVMRAGAPGLSIDPRGDGRPGGNFEMWFWVTR